MRPLLSIPILGLLALSLVPMASADVAPGRFPSETMQLYLTTEEGSPGGVQATGLLLKPEPGGSGSYTFLPVLGALGVEMDSIAWVWEGSWESSREITQDASVSVAFQPLNVEALARFHVSLNSLAPSGARTVLASQEREFNLPRVVASTEQFILPATGRILAAGTSLELVLTADSLDVLTMINYGGSNGAPLQITTRLLDTDGDGVPNDDDACPTVPDCNGNGTPDGDDDPDGDGVTNYYEFLYNLNPNDPDTDDDGIPDGQEDCDNDGIPNAAELEAGTDMCGNGNVPSTVTPLDDGQAVAVEPVLAGGLFAGTSALSLLFLAKRF